MSCHQVDGSGPANVSKQAFVQLAAFASVFAEAQAESRECLGWTDCDYTRRHQRSQLSQPPLTVRPKQKNPINSIKMQRRKEKSPLVIQSGGGQSTTQHLEALGDSAPGPSKLSLQRSSQCFARPGQACKVLKQAHKGKAEQSSIQAKVNKGNQKIKE